MTRNAGNIPAYAGRTTNQRKTGLSPGKHPRIRGENLSPHFSKTYFVETSPHTRGEPIRSCVSMRRRGNIPAYAGRTKQSDLCALSLLKHPRIRGENCQFVVEVAPKSETSPHTRGEQQHIELLIPFCTVFSMQALF